MNIWTKRVHFHREVDAIIKIDGADINVVGDCEVTADGDRFAEDFTLGDFRVRNIDTDEPIAESHHDAVRAAIIRESEHHIRTEARERLCEEYGL